MGITHSVNDQNARQKRFDPMDNKIAHCAKVSESYHLLSNIDVLRGCVDRVIGLESSTASSSDIYNLKFNDPGIPNMIMKAFVCNNPGIETLLRIDKKTKAIVPVNQALIYETYVYKERIAPLLDNNISPFFVRAYGAELDIPFYKMVEFFENTVRIPSITDENKRKNRIRANLVANTIGMFGKQTELIKDVVYCDIDDNKDYDCKLLPDIRKKLNEIDFTDIDGQRRVKTYRKFSSNDVEKFDYGYILTEEIPYNLNEIMSELGKSNNIDDMKNVIFQCAIACASMFYSKLAHNDMHTLNIRVEKHVNNPKKIVYFLYTDLIVEMDCKYVIKVYDFDRAYIEGFTNTFLNGYEFVSQANSVIEPKDLLKVLCYIEQKIIHEIIGTEVKPTDEDWFDLAYWIGDMMVKPGSKISTGKFFETDIECFLRTNKDEPRNKPEDFVGFNDYKTIIKNMATSLGYVKKQVKNIHGVSKYFLTDTIFTPGGKINKSAYLDYQFGRILAMKCNAYN